MTEKINKSVLSAEAGAPDFTEPAERIDANEWMDLSSPADGTSDEITLELDWESAFSESSDESVSSAADGLISSLNRYGRVDIEYISRISGLGVKECIKELKGAIYQNPKTWEGTLECGWETADQYLSGNLIYKRQAAEQANEKNHGYFDENIKAINSVLPPKAKSTDIYVTLGSPWIPPEIIDEFIFSIFGRQRQYMTPKYKTTYDAETGTWFIPDKGRYDWYGTRTLSLTTYGTVRINALTIIEKTLNMKSVSVYDTKHVGKDEKGKEKTKRIFNKAETLLAIEKQNELIRLFREWIFSSKKRQDMLVSIFNERFASVRIRRFNGSFLTLPTISKKIELYPYQKDAIARILFSKNTLLAHDVGSGKTYIMVAAGCELRRMGISRKNLFVVPNSLTGQWKSAFLELCPNAKLLVVTPSSFTPAKRNEILAFIRDGDYDGIIMAYSCFEMIKLSKKYLLQELEERKRRIDSIQGDKTVGVAKLANRGKKLADEIVKLNAAIDAINKNEIYFDELGINTLFVDEAHNFKNLPMDTGVKILGINNAGSKKCADMMDKVRCVQRQNNGRGVVFATGTPITNSITDIFVMQKYLQNGMLELLEMQSFESWVGTFAEKRSEFEIDVDTQSYRVATRFSKFHNIPELTALFAEIADFHKMDKTDGIPELDGYKDILISKTPDFASYLKKISSRADIVRSGRISPKEDNLLKIAGDGRRAALDMRLVDDSAGFSISSKVFSCAEQVHYIYVTTESFRGTQLVFCDTSTPKAGFNIYDELKRVLIAFGLNPNEIAYIHDVESDRRRDQLFEKVDKGEIRVLIGSTMKLGLGVNVQQRLVALHHLDVPWRPADMVQREGRILRQGNLNDKVYIFRYITEGSFDSYIWQLLETKQHFINDILAGFVTERQAEDINEIVLGYGEIKALAIGNPLVKKRVECANELNRLRALHKKEIETRERLERELEEIPAQLKKQEQLIAMCRNDVERLKSEEIPPSKEEKRVFRERLMAAMAVHELAPEERVFDTYRGFEIIIPANMSLARPYVWIRGECRYFLELSASEAGAIIRIDNFISDLPRHLERLKTAASVLRKNKKSIKEELSRNFGYADDIEITLKRLEALDKELGVDNK